MKHQRYKGINRYVYQLYFSINAEIIKSNVEKLLGIDDLGEVNIEIKDDMTELGRYTKDNIYINIASISQLIIKEDLFRNESRDNNNKLIYIFIESVIAHELHHFYMDKFRNYEYESLHYIEDDSLKYAEKELERLAINFEEDYLDYLGTIEANKIKAFKNMKYKIM